MAEPSIQYEVRLTQIPPQCWSVRDNKKSTFTFFELGKLKATFDYIQSTKTNQNTQSSQNTQSTQVPKILNKYLKNLIYKISNIPKNLKSKI